MTVYSTANNISTLPDLMVYGNTVTGGAFGITLLLCIFFISFFTMRNRAVEIAGVNAKIFLASSFLTTFCAVMLFILGVVNDVTLYVGITATAIGIFANMIGGR